MLPVLNRREMRGEPGDVDVVGQPNELAQLPDSQYADVWRALMRRLLAVPGYVAKFNAAFPAVPANALGFQHAATAIAAFVMQEFTRFDSPFDRYLARNDAALSAEAKRGALLFFGAAPCANCHLGPLLGGDRFENVGVPQLGPGGTLEAPLDLGRGELGDLVGPFGPFGPPGAQRFGFRVPPLRNVELTAPYFHNGAYPTLDAVVRHYNDVALALRTYDVSQLAHELRGQYHGEEPVLSDVLGTLSFHLRAPLDLTVSEQRDLVAFLKSLTDPAARDLSALVPPSVPSGLPVR
jgi:cytochrome c peroxidase